MNPFFREQYTATNDYDDNVGGDEHCIFFSSTAPLCSQAIFAAVAVYLKHLGVKSRAVDSKKSRGGFFRRPLGKVSAAAVPR